MDGWISLHRKIMNHAVFSDPDMFRLFTLCLLKATYTKRSVYIGGRKVDLEPGQFITGREALASDYNEGLQKKVDKVDARTLWRWIKRLETWECLSSNSSNKFTVITVVNWAEYQDTFGENVQQIDHQNVQQMSSKCPTDVQVLSTNNKEIKKQSNKEISKDLKITFAEFVHMTQVEYDSLVERLGEDRAKAYIERLDNYKGAKGKRYKSDYRAILTWVNKDESGGALPNAVNRRTPQRPTRQSESDKELERIESEYFISS